MTITMTTAVMMRASTPTNAPAIDVIGRGGIATVESIVVIGCCVVAAGSMSKGQSSMIL